MIFGSFLTPSAERPERVLDLARLTEQAVDLMTLLWIAIWGFIAWQLYQLLAAREAPGSSGQ